MNWAFRYTFKTLNKVVEKVTGYLLAENNDRITAENGDLIKY